MEAGSYLQTLRCVCRNEGAAVYLKSGNDRRLLDLDGEFHREGEGHDPPIACDRCGRTMPGTGH